jgi:hypothetical protein
MNEQDELRDFLKANRPVMITKTPRTESHGIWHKINLAKQSYQSVWAYAVPVLAAITVMMYVSQSDVQQVHLSNETMSSVGSVLNLEQLDDDDDDGMSFVAAMMD